MDQTVEIIDTRTEETKRQDQLDNAATTLQPMAMGNGGTLATLTTSTLPDSGFSRSDSILQTQPANSNIGAVNSVGQVLPDTAGTSPAPVKKQRARKQPAPVKTALASSISNPPAATAAVVVDEPMQQQAPVATSNTQPVVQEPNQRDDNIGSGREPARDEQLELRRIDSTAVVRQPSLAGSALGLSASSRSIQKPAHLATVGSTTQTHAQQRIQRLAQSVTSLTKWSRRFRS